MRLAFDVDVVAIAEVIAFAAASYVDETMHRLALRQGTADVPFGFLHGNLGGDNQLDVKVLRVLYFLLFWHVEVCFARKDRHFLSACGEMFGDFWENL